MTKAQRAAIVAAIAILQGAGIDASLAQMYGPDELFIRLKGVKLPNGGANDDTDTDAKDKIRDERK